MQMSDNFDNILTATQRLVANPMVQQQHASSFDSDLRIIEENVAELRRQLRRSKSLLFALKKAA